MKKSTLILFYFILINSITSQDISGKWLGVLKVQGIQLRLVLNISKSDSSYTATMDSPDQGANGLPVSKVSLVDSIFLFEVANAKISYHGTLHADSITGTFIQGPIEVPLNFKITSEEVKGQIRPQEPKLPYPYYTEDVKFINREENFYLSGTLSLPDSTGKYPAVILISGSGPQNRDEELLGHKPFLVISDFLTRNGFAVLRFDDRGTARSEGDFSKATSDDFANDLESAFNYLRSRKEINNKKIGLMGHSEGGIIAPIVAAKNKKIAFIVMLAGTGVPGDQIMLEQQKLIGRATGMKEKDIEKTWEINENIFSIIKQNQDQNELNSKLKIYLSQAVKDFPKEDNPKSMSEEEIVDKTIEQMANPWMIHFIRFDPKTALQKVKCPVLAVNGEKDLQVSPEQNLGTIKQILNEAGNKKVTIKEFEGLNHLFQHCTTGSPYEYSAIQETFSEDVLKYIDNWIKTEILK